MYVFDVLSATFFSTSHHYKEHIQKNTKHNWDWPWPGTWVLVSNGARPTSSPLG